MKLGIAGVVMAAVGTTGAFGAPGLREARVRQGPPVAATIWSGVYTDEQATRGQALYVQQCVFCHGEALTEGTEAPPLAGDTFLAGWKGETLAGLSEKVITTMPPANPGGLSNEQCVDLLAYMLRVGKAPVGKTDLKGDADALKQIRITPKSE